MRRDLRGLGLSAAVAVFFAARLYRQHAARLEADRQVAATALAAAADEKATADAALAILKDKIGDCKAAEARTALLTLASLLSTRQQALVMIAARTAACDDPELVYAQEAVRLLAESHQSEAVTPLLLARKAHLDGDANEARLRLDEALKVLPRWHAYALCLRMHPDGNGVDPKGIYQDSFDSKTVFPLDDPWIGAKKGQPVAPFAWLSMARADLHLLYAGHWSQELSTQLGFLLEGIVKGYEDPSLKVADSAGVLHSVYASAAALLAREGERWPAGMAEKLVAYPNEILEDGIQSKAEGYRLLSQAHDHKSAERQDYPIKALEEFPDSKYDAGELRDLLSYDYYHVEGVRKNAQRIIDSKASDLAKAHARFSLGEILEKEDKPAAALEQYRESAKHPDDKLARPDEDYAAKSMERIWALEAGEKAVAGLKPASCFTGKIVKPRRALPGSKTIGVNPVRDWHENSSAPELKDLRLAPNTMNQATDGGRIEPTCGKWSLLPVTKELTLKWDNDGCPTEESPYYGGLHLVDSVEKDTVSFDGSWSPVAGVFCAGETMVIPGYSGPGEYGGYGRHYYFWHLPTGQFSIASSGYSGGKACDDGDSSFEPFDILRNVGDVFALRVLVPSNAPVVVLAGARGAVAINPKELTYWGVDLATGKPRPLKPGISACTAEELR